MQMNVNKINIAREAQLQAMWTALLRIQALARQEARYTEIATVESIVDLAEFSAGDEIFTFEILAKTFYKMEEAGLVNWGLTKQDGRICYLGTDISKIGSKAYWEITNRVLHIPRDDQKVFIQHLRNTILEELKIYETSPGLFVN